MPGVCCPDVVLIIQSTITVNSREEAVKWPSAPVCLEASHAAASSRRLPDTTLLGILNATQY